MSERREPTEPKKEKKGKKKEEKSGDRESLRNGVERF